MCMCEMIMLYEYIGEFFKTWAVARKYNIKSNAKNVMTQIKTNSN